MKIWKDLKVSPEEEKLVEEIRAGGIGKSLPEEALKEFQVDWEEDIEIDTRAGTAVVHLYWPKMQEGEKIPLLINNQGGGFVKGRRDQDIVYCRNIDSRFGGAVADIDYVPAPVMRYPGQVYACYDVLQYFGNHGEEMGIDVKRIAMGGHSAGGTLTAASILMAIDQGGFLPALQILDYAGLDLKTPAAEKRNAGSNPRIPLWKSEFYNKMYADTEDTGEVYCSPLLASDEQLAKMPPTLIICCENDVFCDENIRFQNRLMKQGVPVYGKCFLHSSHGFTVQRRDEYAEAEQMILNALNMMMQTD